MPTTGRPAGEHTIFANRCAAGRQLVDRLAACRGKAIVLGLPRGGVVVAYEVAHALEAPLSALVVRKILAPDSSTLVIGAVTAGPAYLDEETIALVDVPRTAVDEIVQRERAAAARLDRALLDGSPCPELRGHTAIIVDDGIVSGATALAAVEVVRKQGAGRIVVAAPVCTPEGYERVCARADDVACLVQLEEGRRLASAYVDFTPAGLAEVRRLLKLARLEREAGFHIVEPPFLPISPPFHAGGAIVVGAAQESRSTIHAGE